MISLYAILAGLFVAGATMTLLWGLRAQREATTLDEERLLPASRTLTLEDVELSLPFSERILRPAFGNPAVTRHEPDSRGSASQARCGVP